MAKTFHMADLFCGAGGTSTGAMQAAAALGYRVNLTAINHWTTAIATHTANHPEARHFCQSLDTINPRELYKRGQLDLLWGSPECMSHSKARGGLPVNDQSRATAWCITRWAEALQPSVILVENVEEFADWGPIGTNGRPLKTRKGDTFRAWCDALRSLGYKVDHRILCAADYGDPTTRRRLFVQAVRGHRKITWPEPSHSSTPGNLFAQKPWVPARDVINWDHPSQSIFTRKRPLSPNTLRRIEVGLKKYGLRPFSVPQQSRLETRDLGLPMQTIVGSSTGEGLCQPWLQRVGHYGKDGNGSHQHRGLDEPIATITTKQEMALAQPYLVQLRGTNPSQLNGSGISLSSPIPSLTAGGRHQGLCEPFLTKFYGTGTAVGLDEPLDTVTTKERFGLCQPIINIGDENYLLDIHFRMLQPDELALAQGFPSTYQFVGNKTQVTKQIGNAVPCGLSRALAGAVFAH